VLSKSNTCIEDPRFKHLHRGEVIHACGQTLPWNAVGCTRWMESALPAINAVDLVDDCARRVNADEGSASSENERELRSPTYLGSIYDIRL
jgi:hypothetical protein